MRISVQRWWMYGIARHSPVQCDVQLTRSAPERDTASLGETLNERVNICTTLVHVRHSAWSYPTHNTKQKKNSRARESMLYLPLICSMHKLAPKPYVSICVCIPNARLHARLHLMINGYSHSYCSYPHLYSRSYPHLHFLP